jgi:hypothetical protein
MNDERTESPESLEQAMARMQPDPVHYQFAYSVLPSKLFQGRAASVLLLQYWRSLEKYFRNLWETMAEQVNPESSRHAQLLSVTAHRIGGKHIVILVEMPPATRVVEAHFVAIVFRPELRYFTLGNSPALIRDDTSKTTFREVTSDGANCNLGTGPEPTARPFLLHICRFLDVDPTVEEIEEHEVHKFAKQVPACGPSVFDSAAGLSILQGFVAKTEREQRTAGASEKLESLFAQLGSPNSAGAPQQIMPRDLPLAEIDVILGSLFSDWRIGGGGQRDSQTNSRGNGIADQQPSTGHIAASRRRARSETLSTGHSFTENRYARDEVTKFDLSIRMISGLVLVGVGVCLGAVFHKDFMAGITSHRWPTVSGVISHAITNSKSRKASRSVQQDFYYPDVAYSYSVNGKRYEGRRFSFSSAGSRDRGVVDRYLGHLLPGANVNVLYHPKDPAVSVLVPGCGIGLAGVYVLAWCIGSVGLIRFIVNAVRFDRA